MEPIRWAPRIRPEKLLQFYQNDAAGMVDEELVSELGRRLFERCQSIWRVTRGEVECPRCGRVFAIAASVGQAIRDSAAAVSCPDPGCGWQSTAGDYHRSWRHQDLLGTAALPAVEEYLTLYPRAASAAERTLCIDRLIQAFHISTRDHLPNRSFANNLIEGSHEEVVALLDSIFAGDPAKGPWRDTIQKMWQRRRGRA